MTGMAAWRLLLWLAVLGAAGAADEPDPGRRARRARRAAGGAVLALNTESFLGGSARSAGCKYAPVMGYLSADCSERKLTGIPPLRPGIEALDMSENKMVAVRNTTFLHIPNVRLLYLNENRIKVVEAGALAVLSYLEVIDLSGNRLRSVPHGLLDLPRLRKLYFADNLLERLDPAFVFASPTLQLLQIAECSLQDVPLGALPELLHLNVSGNALSTLPLHDLARLCRLQTLDISNIPSLFTELDLEEACQCQTFTRWARLRSLDLGSRTRVVCKNETNSADEPYLPTCNATQMAQSALELHGRCVRAQQQELRAQVRSWWVIGMSVACATVMVIAAVLCYCQRRARAEPRHHKVPVVVVSEPGLGNVSQGGHDMNGHGLGGHGRKAAAGQSAPDNK